MSDQIKGGFYISKYMPPYFSKSYTIPLRPTVAHSDDILIRKQQSLCNLPLQQSGYCVLLALASLRISVRFLLVCPFLCQAAKSSAART